MQQTLETFFAGKLLRVPPYQRDYAWEPHHVDDLWGDIREAIDLGAPHFIGTFILAQTPQAGLFDLVDGQQRLTTITMLLQILVDHLPASPEVEVLRVVTRANYLQDAAGSYRLTLLGENHNFFQEVLAGKWPTPSTRSQKRLLRAFRHTQELVSGLTQKNKVNARTWIEQITKLSVMEFVEQNEGNAIRIFSTVNDRGRPLATIEKVKSYLLYVSSKYLGGGLDTALNERFGRVFRAYDRIKDIGENDLHVRLVAQSRFNEDTALRYHFIAYPEAFHDWGITADAILQDALKPHVTRRAGFGGTPEERTALREFVDDYSDDLASFFESFASLLACAEANQQLFKILTSLELSASLYPLAIRLHMRGLLDQRMQDAKAATFLDALEIADLRVYKTRGTTPEKDVARLAADARDIDPPQIAARLSDFIWRFMSDDLFRFRLTDAVYGNNEGARFILLEWEEQVRRTGKAGPLTIEDLKELRATDPTIDHVLAQERTFDLDGRGFSDSDGYIGQIHRLGNLTLVEKRINSSAQKKTPEQKASEDNLYKASAYASSRQLGVAIAESSAAGAPFGASHVDSRTDEIVDFCLRRWPSLR